MMASVSIVSAQNILNISQPAVNTGIPVDNWAWQSITVPQTSTLTTFGFAWNGGSGDLGATATVDLLAGEGTGGALLASTTGSISMVNNDSYFGNVFIADFNDIQLSPGQYTVYIHNPTTELNLVGTIYDSYSGGKFVGDYYGDVGMDATFFTPSPVPEPGSVTLGIMGLACVGGYRAWKKPGRKFLN
jgi:hypothetical protein